VKVSGGQGDLLDSAQYTDLTK
jgi:hypothetical protein